MPHVIRIVALSDGTTTPFDGRWIVSHDDAADFRGRTVTTSDKAKARVFPDAAAAFDYWRQQSALLPLRPDGRPNRQLTAFTIEVESVPGEPA